MFEKLFKFKGPKVEEILEEARSWNDPEITKLVWSYRSTSNPLMKGDILKEIQTRVSLLSNEVLTLEVAA